MRSFYIYQNKTKKKIDENGKQFEWFLFLGSTYFKATKKNMKKKFKYSQQISNLAKNFQKEEKKV